jgi:hypothetical protein
MSQGLQWGKVKNQMADIGRLLSIFLAKPMNFSAQHCGTWLDMFCMLGAIVNLEAQSEQNFLNFWLSIAFDCVRFKSPCQHVLTCANRLHNRPTPPKSFQSLYSQSTGQSTPVSQLISSCNWDFINQKLSDE